MTAARRCCLVFFGLALATGCARASDSETLHLRIENGGDEPMRCVAVLAHFVTRALPTLESGAGVEMTLQREPASGSLSYGAHGSEAMMLENILCGSDVDWTASARDLPLQDLRAVPASRFSYRCALESARMSCAPR